MTYARWVDAMRALPRPSAAQRAAFVEHVAWAHSWYKHLPLLEGGRFLVVLAPDAGEGYSDAHPRTHYGWKTTEEYRQRFGHLDYLWQIDDQPWSRDAGRELDPPPELVARSGLVLFPYCSSDPSAIDVLCELESDAFDALRAGQPHPERRGLVSLHDAWRQATSAWDELDEPARAAASRLAIGEPVTDPPEPTRRHRELVQRCEAAYGALHQTELTKVAAAVDRLIHAL